MIACVPSISVCHSFRLDWKVMFPKSPAGLVGLKDMVLMKFIYKSDSVLRCFNGLMDKNTTVCAWAAPSSPSSGWRD